MWVADLGCWSQVLFLMYCVTFCVPSEALWSLYMFISSIEPIWVHIWMGVTLDDTKSICDQLLVSILLLMSNMDLVLFGLV